VASIKDHLFDFQELLELMPKPVSSNGLTATLRGSFFPFKLLWLIPIWTLAFWTNSRFLAFFAGKPFVAATAPASDQHNNPNVWRHLLFHGHPLRNPRFHYLLKIYTKAIDSQ
jgi:hypothetical protein